VLFLSLYYITEPRLKAIILASSAEAAMSSGLGVGFWAWTRRVPWLMVQATVLSAFSAVMTAAFESDLWFKLKNTVIPGVLAFVILGALQCGRNLLQMALAPYYSNLLGAGWNLLAVRMAGYQLLFACLNEVIWRT